MLKQKVTIINKLGLHARAAMKLINEASRYQSEIIIHYRNHEVNAKSILNVMAIGASKGSELEFTVEGNDEAEAMQAMIDLINNRFGESE